jgi:tetratricopeptide (TPR) repeat protein
MATHDGKSGRTGPKGHAKATGRSKRRQTMTDAAPVQPRDALPAFPDRRLLEQQLTAVNRLLSEHEFASVEEANTWLQQQLASGGGTLPLAAPTTPLEEAQEVVYQALQASGARRTALARKALTLSPDCADAYVLLAEAATDPQAARRLYEQGVAAGERALGAETFAKEAGSFWGLVETRPYMRAREGLAHVLWHLGEREAALAHAQDLLRLNPGDNQGIRYVLATWLLAVGDAAAERALEQLLAQYPDEWSAQWAYTQALHAFRRQGAGRQADRALERAVEVNPHVPFYLLGITPFPKELPVAYGMGDEQEAVVYVAQAAQPWLETPGAAEWLARVLLRLARPSLAAPSRGRAPAKPAPAKPAPAKPAPATSEAPARQSSRPRQPRRPRAP